MIYLTSKGRYVRETDGLYIECNVHGERLRGVPMPLIDNEQLISRVNAQDQLGAALEKSAQEIVARYAEELPVTSPINEYGEFACPACGEVMDGTESFVAYYKDEYVSTCLSCGLFVRIQVME